jgi:hypothetical protein
MGTVMRKFETIKNVHSSFTYKILYNTREYVLLPYLIMVRIPRRSPHYLTNSNKRDAQFQKQNA